MKKIIAAFDGLKYSESTEMYATYIAKHTNAHLIGVFLDDPVYTSYKVYEAIMNKKVPATKIKMFQQKDKALRSAAAGHFEKACQEEKLEYSVHHDQNISSVEVKHESVYSDLLVIDSKETFTHYTEELPTRFIQNLLSDIQCPVLVVPQKYRTIQKLILLYDGNPSSVYAIKMFSYLLPQLKHLDTEVIAVNPVEASLHMPDNKLMKEFMKRHFPKARYNVMKGSARYEIVKYLKQVQVNALVVLGAYRRGPVSRWVKESMADTLMKEVKLPLFIAHS